MNKPKVTDIDYIHFTIGSPKIVTGTEAERCQPARHHPPAHDAFTRLLQRHEPDAETLYKEIQPLIHHNQGVLVIDDSTLDKPHAKEIALVTHHWSGNHHKVVKGINLITLLWTDGDQLHPTDYRLYHKSSDGLTKNDHFAAMLKVAKQRGFQPEAVLFDGWYSSLDNLKTVDSFDWTFVTRFKSNRKVRLDHGPKLALHKQPIAEDGTIVDLPGFGRVRVFRIVAKDGTMTHWATNELGLEPMDRLKFAELSWSIEEYHRGLKQFTGVSGCQCRSERSQRNHIGFALRALVRLEYHRFHTGVSWFASKWEIIRESVRRYLERPLYELPRAPTA